MVLLNKWFRGLDTINWLNWVTYISHFSLSPKLSNCGFDAPYLVILCKGLIRVAHYTNNYMYIATKQYNYKIIKFWSQLSVRGDSKASDVIFLTIIVGIFYYKALACKQLLKILTADLYGRDGETNRLCFHNFINSIVSRMNQLVNNVLITYLT